jgi:hypothetical protein
MVWVLSLSDLDLSTQALTPVEHVMAFGVCQNLVGGEAP